MKSPRLVPESVPVVTYLVLDDFGKPGRAYRETEEHVDDETIIANLIRGEYERPQRVIAFCVEEGWSRDVSEDLAREVVTRVDALDELPDATRAFVDEHLGELPAKMPPEPSAH